MQQESTAQNLWRIELFGSLRVSGQGRTIEKFPTQKTSALLAFLAYYHDREHSREVLADMLWPDADFSAARDRLSQALVWLRPQLEPPGVPRGSVLIATRLTVGLNGASLTTDTEEFASALLAARRAETPSLRAAALERAVDLYQGELLPGQYGDWVLTERQRLLEEYLQALRQLITFSESEGQYERALGYARRALAADSLREEAHGDLIRLLAVSGQKAAALRQFQQLQTLLAKELDTEPSPDLRELIERIRQEGVPSPPPAPPVPALPPAPTLPTAMTRLFGREAEIEEICRLLQTEGVRLVTLTGTGGAGKTRLSVAVAARLQKTRTAVFVPLADLNDARMIPAAIAGAMRLKDSVASSPVEKVVDALSIAPSLLVLDNLEHLLAEATPLVRELLERVSDLTVLATSRQRLGLEGEREVPVRSLPLPGTATLPEQTLAAPSVQLFADRAQAVRPDFRITPENADAVARLCRRLDGLPLAIELCAAWAQTLTPPQMLEKLDRRFDLLVSRRTDIASRHRTLRAAMEYSYLLLPGNLQRLFTRLSLFRGGWDLEAAESVCSEASDTDPMFTLTELTELRERSLIVAEEVSLGEFGTEMRYRMLETLREFAGEQLTYADRATRRRLHAEYYLALVEQAAAGISGREQKRWLTRLDGELENLRTALAWTLESNEIETGLRLADALGTYWSMRGPLIEGYHWLQQLFEKAESAAKPIPSQVQARALRTLGHLAWSQGEYLEAREAHGRALALRREIGDAVGITESLYHLGITAYRLKEYAAAQAFLGESRDIAQERGDQASIARVLLNLGNIAYEEGRHIEGRAFFQQSLAIERELGNRKRVADALNNLGLIALAEKDYPQADHIFEDSLALYREITDNYGATFVLANLGTIARLLGQGERARALMTEGLKAAAELGNKYVIIHYLLQLGLLESEEGRAARSVFLISAAHRLSDLVEGSQRLTDADGYAEAQQVNRDTLGDRAFESAWAQGQSATLTQAVTLAFTAEEEPGGRYNG